MLAASLCPSLFDDDLAGWLPSSLNRRSALPAQRRAIIVTQTCELNQAGCFPYPLDAFARRGWLLLLPVAQAKLDDLRQAILDWQYLLG